MLSSATQYNPARHRRTMLQAACGRNPARPPAAVRRLKSQRVSLFPRRSGTCKCASGGQHNGAEGPTQDSSEDPVEAMMRVAKEEMGMSLAWSDPQEDEEEYLDTLEDLEDVWMRNPSPPEWAEVTGILQDDTISGSSAGNGSSTATEHPGQRISTVSWQELQQQLQDSQQQGLVILDVLVKPGDQQQQQPIRAPPHPLPWRQSSNDNSETGAPMQHQQLSLQEITRDVAVGWQDKAAVAVVDNGHHSCLAAAIRLSAVYRLPQVVLLQL